MVTVRPIGDDELDWYVGLDPESPELGPTMRGLWADGSGRPAWTLVAEDDGPPIGRAALLSEPFGCGLPILEGQVAGLWLDWDRPEHARAAAALLDAVAELARGVMPFVERRLNPEVHRDVDRWREVLEGGAFTLFQEKEGFAWTDEGGPARPTRLEFRPLAEVGRAAFASAMAEAIGGTLDRNDRFYVDACSEAGWGRQMVEFAAPVDELSWLLGYEPDGTLVGYVGVSEFEEGVATIAHIGVVPARRGRGYVDDLLLAANAAARARGYRQMLSDVDTENRPMLAAMERNGHRRGVRPWHVWAYRRRIDPAHS